MIPTLQPLIGSTKVIAVGDLASMTRGRPAEFRHHGLVVANRPTAITALLELGRDPRAVMLVPSDLECMPLIDFIDVLRGVAHVPVIAGLAPGVTARTVSDLFDHGVATTVALPVTPRALATAVRVTHVPMKPQKLTLELGELALDDARHVVTWFGRALSLSPKNFEILRYLMLAAPRVVPVRELMAIVGETGAERAVRTRVAVKRLRNAFVDAVPARRAPIETVRGVGYRLSV